MIFSKVDLPAPFRPTKPDAIFDANGQIHPFEQRPLSKMHPQ